MQVAMLLPSLVQVSESISGSVVPLAMFFTNSPRWHWVADPRASDLRVCPPLRLKWIQVDHQRKVGESESGTLKYARLKNKIRATNFCIVVAATWNDPWDVDGGVLLFPTHHVEA